MTAPTYYKVLAPEGHPRHSGRGIWHLPTGKRPGKWMPAISPVVPCQSGYHLCTIDQLVRWLGPEIWVAEGRGDHIDHGDKHVFAQARIIRRVDTWNERTARLFAADCAEAVLPIFEKHRPGDQRPRQAIAVARRYANGDATDTEVAAARAAASAATRAAASAATGDAARAAARAATGDATRAAAWAATWAAASAAAWAATWAAASAATWAATWAAASAATGDAAWAATWAATGDAARDAARAAASANQTRMLMGYLEVTP